MPEPVGPLYGGKWVPFSAESTQVVIGRRCYERSVSMQAKAKARSARQTRQSAGNTKGNHSSTLSRTAS